ncbi:hypothetical protein EUTSA_v10024112mg [Eutrema salsugineum]|uniref:SGNH hydrolase-type esterase domain-containing protein n=1 Tax=Eutrema salsugineum TaxID=72664 RepID=V4KDW3_EUTSA|nr:hypothetical protein EUTSA_v10024112mg [Eutrema salsugineum]
MSQKNALVNLHNKLLHQVVSKLNNETEQLSFVFLDYYNAFSSVFMNKRANLGTTKFENPLKTCCEDDVHPSQEGWSSVYTVLSKRVNQVLTEP